MRLRSNCRKTIGLIRNRELVFGFMNIVEGPFGDSDVTVKQWALQILHFELQPRSGPVEMKSSFRTNGRLDITIHENLQNLFPDHNNPVKE